MPNRMRVDRDDNGQLFYQYNTSKDDAPTMNGSMVNLKSSDVLHIPGLGFDGLVGYSPIAMAKNAIGMAIACEEYGAKFFANGATPGGILEHRFKNSVNRYNSIFKVQMPEITLIFADIPIAVTRRKPV